MQLKAIKYPYDLRASVEEKQEDSLSGGWTAFVNNSATILHLINPDIEGAFLRFKLKPSLKGCSKRYIYNVCNRKLNLLFY